MERFSNDWRTAVDGAAVGEAVVVITSSGGLRIISVAGDTVGCSVSVSFPADPPSVVFVNAIWVGLIVGTSGTVEFLAAAFGVAVGGALVTEINGMNVGSKVAVGGTTGALVGGETTGILVGGGGLGGGGLGVGGLGVGGVCGFAGGGRLPPFPPR